MIGMRLKSHFGEERFRNPWWSVGGKTTELNGAAAKQSHSTNLKSTNTFGLGKIMMRQ